MMSSSFSKRFFDKARALELAAGRYGIWSGVQVNIAAATHVERLFGFVQETRNRCTVCRGSVLSYFSSERVLRVTPREVPGGPMTVAEMYMDACAPEHIQADCDRCQLRTVHESQSRMLTGPNVLVLQIRRGQNDGGLLRTAVSVEELLSLPGLPDMELGGVVYHNGVTLQSGHYTSLCRGPGGRFWFYDDNKPVHRMEKEVAHIKPKEVYMVVYCRRGGSAAWVRRAVGSAAVVVSIDGEDVGRGCGGGRTVESDCGGGGP